MTENKEVLEEAFFADFFNEGLYLLKDDKTKAVFSEPKPVLTQVQEPIHEELTLQGVPLSDTLVLVFYPGKKDIPAPEKEFLTKILGAIKLNFKDIAWLNVSSTYSLNWNVFKALPATKIIAFDPPVGLLPETIELHTLTNLDNKQVFITEDLAKVDAIREFKTKLWEALQKMYL